MRISTNAISSNVMYDVERASERFFHAQQTVSSGKRLNQPSDDPASMPSDLTLRATISSLTQYQKNLDTAKGFVGTSDVAVGNAAGLLRNARVLAVQGASDTLTSQDRQALADQVDQLIKSLATVANSQYGSRYLFGGQRTTQPPFVQQNGDYVYQGGSRTTGDADLKVDSAANQPMTINRPGDEVFSAAFQALKDLRANLNYGQPTRISNENLPQLDRVLNSLTTTQADLGATAQQIQQTSDRYASMQTDLASALSNVEDADMPQAILEMNTAQTAYQAALTASARSYQQSLLDFLK